MEFETVLREEVAASLSLQSRYPMCAHCKTKWQSFRHLSNTIGFSKANLICLTETWLSEDMDNINLQGYSMIRFARDATRTAKRIGGGLCMFINTGWATYFMVRETDCSTHFE